MRSYAASVLRAEAGPEQLFTGQVFIEWRAAPGALPFEAALVTFAPGARTNWHTHPNGQLLVVESGRGVVQKRGEPVRRMHPGDVVIIGPGEEHWHGAAPDSVMAHLAVQSPDADGVATRWLEPVSDEDYLSAPADPFDGSMAAIGRRMLDRPPEDVAAIDLAGFRAADQASVALFGPPEPGGETLDLEIEITGDRRMRARLYRPGGAASDRPLLLYVHGGGFVRGSVETHDAMLSRLCNRSRAVVLAPDWPLAPEHPFPQALEALEEVYAWCFAHQDRIGFDGRLALAGDSAGGNLAAALALRIGARRPAPPPDALVLIHPVLDLTGEQPSRRAYAQGYGLTTAALAWAADQYAPAGVDRRNPLVSPLFATDDQLRALPPALVVQAELDPARDDGERFAERLRRMRKPVTLTRWPGVVHNFTLMAGVVDAGMAAIDDIGRFVRALPQRGDR